MDNYYVYRHFKLASNEVFYVGMGKELNFRRSRYSRNRNNHWHHIVNKYGYFIEVIATDLSEEDAIELEIFLILEYGRRDLNTGCLVNLTDGGEGVFNPSENSLKSRKVEIAIEHNVLKIWTQKKSLHHWSSVVMQVI